MGWRAWIRIPAWPVHESVLMRRAKVDSDRGSRILRFLDRIIGIPLVAVLGLFRSRGRELTGAVRAIGVLETAAIGDTTLLSAVIRDLRAAYPAAHIVVFAGSSNIAIARLLDGVDEIIKLPIKNVLAACRSVRRQRFDLFLDYGPWPRINAVITHFAHAAYKVGFKTHGQFRHYVYDKAALHSNAQHELENFRDLLRAINVPPRNEPGFPKSVGQEPLSESFRPSSHYIVFHLWPGGWRSYLKEWPVERWLDLGSRLAAAGFEIALSGAPSDRGRNEETIVLSAAQGRSIRWLNCAGATIEQTIALLRGARLTVSVNTGVMHMAAVLGVPVVGLHGPTAARRWGPVGRNAVAISSPASGCGYLDLGFEYPRDCECMQAISVDQVLSQCLLLLRLSEEKAV